MALNPPLLPGGMPMGIVGEQFILQRTGVQLEVERPGAGKLKSTGSLFLTSVRLCLVFASPQGDVAAVDVPIQGIKGDPEFKQPIFGANRLEARVIPVPGRGLATTSDIGFTIYFMNGGAGKLLRALFTLIEQYRRADHAARQTFMEPTRLRGWMTSMGAQDPSDPSTFFLSQPPSQQQWQGYSAPPQPTMAVMPGSGGGYGPGAAGGPGPSAGGGKAAPTYAQSPPAASASGAAAAAPPGVNPAYLAAIQGASAGGPAAAAGPPMAAPGGYGAPPGMMGGPGGMGMGMGMGQAPYPHPQAGYGPGPAPGYGYPPQAAGPGGAQWYPPQGGPGGYGAAPGPGMMPMAAGYQGHPQPQAGYGQGQPQGQQGYPPQPYMSAPGGQGY